MKLKYVIWLRNILIILFVLVLADFLVKQYYDHVPTSVNPARFIISLSSIVFLQYYIQKQQKANE